MQYELEPISEYEPDLVLIWHRPLSVVGLRRKQCPVQSGSDGMGSIASIPQALRVPSFHHRGHGPKMI
jgi:hypothetical protein